MKAKPRAKSHSTVKKPTGCYYTQTKSTPDYKEVLVLKKFLTERGKILHKSITGLTAKNQRLVSSEVKKARFMALLPYTDRHAL